MYIYTINRLPSNNYLTNVAAVRTAVALLHHAYTKASADQRLAAASITAQLAV
jgi:hypothetical protein